MHILISRPLYILLLKLTAVVILAAVALSAAVPQGWYLAGPKRREYISGVDEARFNGHRIVYLKAVGLTTEGFGTLMQDFRADRYAAKRIQLRAALKTDHVNDWAGLWMRVDKNLGLTSKVLAFDNMQDRPVKGTTDWQHYQVVLDVPSDASTIMFGVILSGPGNVLISEFSIEAVGNDVPTTSVPSENLYGQSPSRADWRQRFDSPFNLELNP